VENKLIPAHILFVKWFIRIRWIAIVTLIISNYVVKNIFQVTIQDIPVYFLAFLLFILNIFHSIILKNIIKKEKRVICKIKQEIDFQIISDLIILTIILHYSGGIENPLVLFYFFHLIIASSIFSALKSYIYAAFAIFLISVLTILECYSVIPHYHMEGFVDHDLYKNTFYLFGAGFVFTCTSILVVSLSHMIINRSIKSEESCAAINVELEKKDKLKNEYVLHVTHDIKGHLAAILSCLEVIRKGITGPLNKEQENFINRVFERTELLSNFVKNLLNLTKIRLEHRSEFEEFSLRDLLNKVIIPIQILARDKSLNFNINIDKSIDKITGNPYTIEELYSNLLLNAIKYTQPNGQISITVKNRLNHIVSEITDSGMGIPSEEIVNVFDEFYRASNVPKDDNTGSGLGLSIAKQIVKNHKGRIWVKSEIGAWTQFTFILPKNPAVNP